MDQEPFSDGESMNLLGKNKEDAYSIQYMICFISSRLIYSVSKKYPLTYQSKSGGIF